jgi:hypothetical protein
MSKLFQSRKFLLILVDAVFIVAGGAAAFFIGDPDWQKFLALVLAAIQPVFVGAVIAVAVEDSAALKAGTHPNQKDDNVGQFVKE